MLYHYITNTAFSEIGALLTHREGKRLTFLILKDVCIATVKQYCITNKRS
jgi:hypothetical protein